MSDEYVVIPPDRLEDDQLNVENRLHIISKINACETKKEELDTSVIDQLLGLFHGSNVFIFATMCTTSGQLNPVYTRYIGQHGENTRDIVVLPLCDSHHFYGFMVELKKSELHILIH